MRPKRIILIRHGESEGNIDHSIYARKPDYALELSEQGMKQAKEAGRELKDLIKEESAFFYVSPFWRTWRTYEQIAISFHPGQLSYVEEPRLREQEWGHLRSPRDKKKIDKERDEYGPFYFRIPGGESCADVYDRVSDFLGTLHRDIAREEFPENAIIITHGMTLRVFLMRWYHWSVEEFESYGNPTNCQIVIMERNDSGKYDLKSKLRHHMVNHNYQRDNRLAEN